jgi:hypothetical protein
LLLLLLLLLLPAEHLRPALPKKAAASHLQVPQILLLLRH